MTSTRGTQNPGEFQSLCLSHQITKLCRDQYNLYLEQNLKSFFLKPVDSVVNSMVSQSVISVPLPVDQPLSTGMLLL